MLFLLVRRHELADRWRYAATAFAHGLVVGGLLLVFPLLYALAGPQSLIGGPNLAATVSLVSERLARRDRAELRMARHESSHGHSDPKVHVRHAPVSGNSLLVALLLFAVFLRQRRAILFAGAMAVIAFVLSLGPRLWVDGHETPLPLPFVVFEHLPVLKSLDPARFALYTALFAAAMFAIGLDELWRRMRRSGRPAWMSLRWRSVARAGALAVLSAAVVIPLAPRDAQPTSQTKVPSFFTSAAVDAIPPGSVVLAYPYPDLRFFEPSHDIMLDQAVAAMRFKLIGGYGWSPSPAGPATLSPSVLEPESVENTFDAAFAGSATAQAAPHSESDVQALRVFSS